MTPQNTVDLKGNFNSHPFAELLVEIDQAKLSGSLRLSLGDKKTVVYIRDGEVVYAVSNARVFRLFSVLLESGKINNNLLVRFPNFANDMEFAAFLIDQSILTKEEIYTATVDQIRKIIIDSLVWPDAEWVFSPLARLRSDLIYDADIYNVLIEYGRCIPPEKIFRRFKSVNETFVANRVQISDFLLEKQEFEVFSMFGSEEMTIDQLKPLCKFPDSALLQALYSLWLGGILERRNWNAAFSPGKLEHIRTAKMSPVKAEPKMPLVPVAANPPVEQSKPAAVDQVPKVTIAEIPLEEYLRRVEGAETHYDIMGVTNVAPSAEIKASYLMMVKLFHPDRYHRETGQLLRRIQVAFTNLAQAYETLKEPQSRENYDYKMRRELEMREKRRAEGMPEVTSDGQTQSGNGSESFEAGLNFFMEEDYGAAATQFARSVHERPENALYHSYYGQALSFLEKFQHKAEAELQAAVRLDPKNAAIRLIVAQFFIDRNMVKRAEGELNRFLEIVPGNKEAKDLLRSLQS